MITVSVKEKSWIAFIAARVLKTRRVAIVINRTIYLHHTTYNDFTGNQPWLLHELTHVAQYRQHGTMQFIMLYLFESLRKGYSNNKFEIEARAGENNVSLLGNYELRLST